MPDVILKIVSSGDVNYGNVTVATDSFNNQKKQRGIDYNDIADTLSGRWDDRFDDHQYYTA